MLIYSCISTDFKRFLDRLEARLCPLRLNRCLGIACGVALIAIALPARAAGAGVQGRYDGSQTEMAVALELREDGRFQYWLSYGALDEEAEGRWQSEGGNVILSSDPVVAPRFVFQSSSAARGAVNIILEAPQSLPISLFAAAVKYSDGEIVPHRMSEEGLRVPVSSAHPAVSVRVALPVMEIVGDEIQIPPGGGRTFRFRFEPNDFGKVDFRGVVLEGRDGMFLLQRHGREIRFRRVGD